MVQEQLADIPKTYQQLSEKSEELGFTMPSDIYVGALLRTLVASRPNGRFLELGTGMGLSLSWMVDGMVENSNLTSLDNDPGLVAIVAPYFQKDSRVKVLCVDGAQWLDTYNEEPFDLIFADAWPGKYSHLQRTLGILRPGGFYVIDDMLPQTNWPDGHGTRALELISHLDRQDDLMLTKLDWSTGVIIAVKT